MGNVDDGVVCEFCGNDTGAYSVCLDCLTPTPGAIARFLAVELGGEAVDYAYIARRMAVALW